MSPLFRHFTRNDNPILVIVAAKCKLILESKLMVDRIRVSIYLYVLSYFYKKPNPILVIIRTDRNINPISVIVNPILVIDKITTEVNRLARSSFIEV